MNRNNLLALTIALTVGIIVAGSVLMPVLNDASSDEHYSNALDSDAVYKLKLLDPTATVTISVDMSTSVMTIGDTTFTIDATHEAYIASDHAWFRVYVPSSTTVQYRIDGMDANATTTSNCTITFANGSATFSSGSTALTWTTSEFLFVPSVYGTYGLRSPSEGPQYVNSINDIYVCGVTNNKLVWGQGSTLTDGSNSYEAVFTSAVSLVDGSTNVYEMPTQKDYRMQDGGSGYYPNRTIIPLNISGTSESWDNISSLLGAIPVLIIASLVISAVAIIKKPE